MQLYSSVRAGNRSAARQTPPLRNLLGIAADAVKLNPPLYLSSVLGLPWTWIPPFDRYSEFKILDLWRLRRTFTSFLNVTVPSLPLTPLPFGPPSVNDLLFHPTVILQRPDHNGNYTTWPREAWFFINGILTNDAVAQINAAYLAYLFHRPLTLIQNSTDSFALDLFECAIGKEWFLNTESVVKAFPPIYDALKSDKEKVVVIAHSQGTIIIARVLRLLAAITRPPRARRAGVAAQVYAPPEFVYPEQEALDLGDFEPLQPDELAKLEVYCFANCANRMSYWKPPRRGSPPVPWIESFGNANDLVARLGMLNPRPAHWGIRLDGPQYVRPGAWGHLLNQHYLSGIEASQKQGRKHGGRGDAAPFVLANRTAFPRALQPRLFDYLNGGSPDPL